MGHLFYADEVRRLPAGRDCLCNRLFATVTHLSLLRDSEASCCRLPIHSILPQIPSTQPCLLDGFPPVFSEVLAPTTFGAQVTPLHDCRPVGYTGHVECLPVR